MKISSIVSSFGVVFAVMGALSHADSFAQHNVSIYAGPLAKPNFKSLAGSVDYKTRIRDGIWRGVNFAGHYTIITFVCGTSCTASFLVDVKSGKIFDVPLGGETNYSLQLDYRPNSKLIKSSWIEGYGDSDGVSKCVRQEFVLKGTKFKLLHQTKTAIGEDTIYNACNPQ